MSALTSRLRTLSTPLVGVAVAALFAALAAACGGGSSASSAPAVAAISSAEPIPTTFDDPPTPPKATGNPLIGMKFFVDPDSNAGKRAKFLAATNPTVAKLLDERIAKQPTAVWVGDWNSN